MKFSVLFTAALVAFAAPLVRPVEAQQLDDEAMQAILDGGTFEVGRSPVRESGPPPERQGAADEATAQQAQAARQQQAQAQQQAQPQAAPPPQDPGAALFSEVMKAAAESGAPTDMRQITGVAKQLLGAATGGAGGGPPMTPMGKLGASLTGSVLDVAASMSEKGMVNPETLTSGGGAGMLQQVGSMMGVAGAVGGLMPGLGSVLDVAGAAHGLAPQPAAVATPSPASLGDAQALLDAYNASVTAAAAAAPVAVDVEEPVAEEVEEPTPVRRVNARVQPSRARPREMDEEEDADDGRDLPWASRSNDNEAESRPAPASRARLTGSAPARSPRDERIAEAEEPAAARVAEPQPRRAAPASVSAPSAAVPERYQDLLDGIPSYEEAVAEREGDWFIVLGSYNLRSGADPLPSPDVDGSADPAGSVSIAGAQQRLWEAGYVPYVVRSDAVPGFRDGLAVIVVGPLTQSEAAAELPQLRGIVSDAYIKAGW